MRFFRNKATENDELIAQISHVAETVVGRYVVKKAIPKREQEDVKMVVLEKFLLQRDKIMAAFQGKASLNTYFVAVLNRMVCEVIRKESRHWYAVVENESENESFQYSLSSSMEAEKELILKYEVVRFHQTLLFFNGTGDKVNLFLKFYFGLPIQPLEYERYGRHHARELSTILQVDEMLSKGTAFNQMAKAVNLVEGKNLKGDAVRMWLNNQMDVILNRLNASGGSQHNRESLALLCELSAVNTTTTN